MTGPTWGRLTIPSNVIEFGTKAHRLLITRKAIAIEKELLRKLQTKINGKSFAAERDELRILQAEINEARLTLERERKKLAKMRERLDDEESKLADFIERRFEIESTSLLSPPPELSEITDLKYYNFYLKTGPAVYFLLQNKIVVYVGQTVSLGARITSHIRESSKEFTEVWYVCCPPNQLTAVEAFYIKQFRPRYNQKGKERIR